MVPPGSDFTKFFIVVSSIAIKEGVYKSLQITADHFKGLYAGVPLDYFLYDSSMLGEVRNFATSANIQIMVVTVGSNQNPLLEAAVFQLLTTAKTHHQIVL